MRGSEGKLRAKLYCLIAEPLPAPDTDRVSRSTLGKEQRSALSVNQEECCELTGFKGSIEPQPPQQTMLSSAPLKSLSHRNTHYSNKRTARKKPVSLDIGGGEHLIQRHGIYPAGAKLWVPCSWLWEGGKEASSPLHSLEDFHA